MAGRTRRKYQTDANHIFYVQLDSRNDVLGIAGTEPDGGATENITLKVAGNKNEVGLHPRYALFARKIGGADGGAINAEEDPQTPAELGYVQTAAAYKKIPLLTKAAGDALTSTTSIVLGSETFTFVKVVDERRV